MGFCPKCKYEYREGITVCHDCKLPLVDNLEEYEKNLAQQMQQEMEQEMLKQREQMMQQAYGSSEIMEEEAPVPLVARNQRHVKQHTFVDKHTRAEDYRSSGITLLGAGIVGAIFLILLYTNVISGLGFLKNNVIFMVVMSAMFIIFIFSGIYSLANVKKILEQAKVEDQKISEMKDFMKYAFTKESFAMRADSLVPESERSDESLYFIRIDYMNHCMREQYPLIDEALLEKLVEDHYNEVYEDYNS